MTKKAKVLKAGLGYTIRDLAQEIVDLDFVENLGFLDKNNPNEYQKYPNTWSKVHLLLLPTRAECAGIVFNEASVYGVPILSPDTGGVSDYVFNDCEWLADAPLSKWR